MLLNRQVITIADYIYTNGELYHYGVKGMRWGARKDKPLSKTTKSTKKKTVNDVGSNTIQRGKNAVKSMNLNIQLFAHKRSNRMPKAVSEAITNASYKQRNSPSYTMNVGDIKYLVINRPGDSPIVKPLYKITKTIHDK